MKAFAYLVFPNSIMSVLPEESLQVQGEPMEHGIISSVTHGAMSGNCAYHPSVLSKDLRISFNILYSSVPAEILVIYNERIDNICPLFKRVT